MEEIQGYKFAFAMDDGGMVRTMKEIRNEAKMLRSSMNSNFKELASGGDKVKAYENKLKDLNNAIKAEKLVVSQAQSQQKELDLETVKGRQEFAKLQTTINSAKNAISGYQTQTDKAKSSLKYYQSGIDEVNKQLKLSSESSKVYVERLKAEGKTAEANKVKMNGLGDQLGKLETRYKKQSSLLADIEKESGKTSEAYLKQKIALDKTGTSIADTRNDMSKLNSEMKQANPSIFTKIRTSMSKMNKTGKESHSIFKSIFSGAFWGSVASNVVSGAWNKISSAIGNAKDSAMEYATAQQTMNATWLTLTGNAKEGKKMVDMTNEMAVAAANSTDMVDSMNQKFYAITKNADITKGLTKSVLTLQDAFGATDDAVMNFSTQFAQMQANGKVSAQDMMSFVNVFPVLRTELLKTMRQQTGNSKLTMQQMNDLMSAGKISSETMDKVLTGTAKKYSSATENFAKTVPGLARTIKSQMPVLIGNFTQPLLKLKNPLLGSISNWITDKATYSRFEELGKKFSDSLNKMIGSFTGGNSQKKIFDSLNSGIDRLGNNIANTFDYIGKHAGDIKGISSDLWSITKTIGGEVWTIFKGTIKTVAEWLGVGGKNAKDMKDPLKTVHAILDKIADNKDALKTVGKIIVGMFVAKKALAFAGALESVAGGLKNIAGYATEKGLLHGLNSASTVKAATQTTASTVAEAGTVASAATGSGAVAKGASALVKGAGVAAIGGAAISAGFDLYSAFKEKNPKKKFDSYGAAIGTAIGGGIGAAFGPAGIAIGATIGREAGKWGRTAVTAIKKTFDKTKEIKPPKINTKTAYDNLNKASKKYYSEKQKQDKKDLELLKKNGLISDAEYKKRMKTVEAEGKKMSRFETMNQSDRTAISKYYAQERQKLETKWNKKIRSDTSTWNSKINADTARYGANSVQVQRDIANKNKAIKKDEADKTKALNNQKLKFATKVTAKEAKLYTTLNGSIQRSSNKQKSILSNLTKQKGKLSNKQLQQAVNDSAKEYSKVTANAEKQRKKVVNKAEAQYNSVVKAAGRQRDNVKDAAEEQYKKTVAASKRQYKGNSKWAKEQRKKVKKEAETQRDNAKNAADKQYSDVVTKAQNQKNKVSTAAYNQKSKVTEHAKDQYDQVKEQARKQSKNVVKHATNQANSSMNANKKQASGIHGIWKSIVDFFNGLTKPFGVKKVSLGANNASYKPVAMGAYATGTSISKAGKALVGEAGTEARYRPYSGKIDFIGTNGAEIIDVNPGDQILNATDTARLLSGNYHSTLPGYAKGTFSIGNLLGTAQDKLSGIWEDVSEKAQNAISKITHPIKTLKEIVSKTFNLNEQNIGSLPKSISKGLVNNVIKGAAKAIDNLKKKISDVIGDAGGGKGAPKGSGVQRWKGQLKKALKANGLPTTSAYVNAWLRQISFESGGNEKAVQGGYTDINTITGDLAKGLLQTISATFNAYKFPGHGNIFNGYDNMLAAINYAKHRYGSSSMLQVIGHGHGYSNGGIVNTHQIAEIAENNMAEAVVPMSSVKRSRGYEILGKVAAHFIATDPQRQQVATTGKTSDSSKTEAQLAILINLVGKILGINSDQLRAMQSNGNMNDLYTKMASDQSMLDFQSF